MGGYQSTLISNKNEIQKILATKGPNSKKFYIKTDPVNSTDNIVLNVKLPNFTNLVNADKSLFIILSGPGRSIHLTTCTTDSSASTFFSDFTNDQIGTIVSDIQTGSARLYKYENIKASGPSSDVVLTLPSLKKLNPNEYIIFQIVNVVPGASKNVILGSNDCSTETTKGIQIQDVTQKAPASVATVAQETQTQKGSPRNINPEFDATCIVNSLSSNKGNISQSDLANIIEKCGAKTSSNSTNTTVTEAFGQDDSYDIIFWLIIIILIIFFINWI